MSDETRYQPLFKEHILIVLGGLMVMGFTLYGVLNNPDELIRQDVRLGPVIAAGRIVVPLFLTVGVMYMISQIKQCKHCGKILLPSRLTRRQ
ncbi:MAG: hypothetical protein HQL55_01320, partial [Magnetococcales bacterium]|nr:hypothetical protein [Magnetococcales bacterium]